MKTTSGRKDIYGIINNMIMENLQNGKAPWRQTRNDFGPARNYVNKEPYPWQYRLRMPSVSQVLYKVFNLECVQGVKLKLPSKLYECFDRCCQLGVNLHNE